MKQRDDSQIELWNWFDNFMDKLGYQVIAHNDEYMGRGSVAFKEDRFAPIFNLHLWSGATSDDFVSLHVLDRNGYTVLAGKTSAIYSMADAGDNGKNVLIFEKMLGDALEKYSGYSRDNRLDFAFNELEQDRRAYDDKVLTVDELVNIAEGRSVAPCEEDGKLQEDKEIG